MQRADANEYVKTKHADLFTFIEQKQTLDITYVNPNLYLVILYWNRKLL